LKDLPVTSAFSNSDIICLGNDSYSLSFSCSLKRSLSQTYTVHAARLSIVLATSLVKNFIGAVNHSTKLSVLSLKVFTKLFFNKLAEKSFDKSETGLDSIRSSLGISILGC